MGRCGTGVWSPWVSNLDFWIKQADPPSRWHHSLGHTLPHDKGRVLSPRSGEGCCNWKLCCFNRERAQKVEQNLINSFSQISQSKKKREGVSKECTYCAIKTCSPLKQREECRGGHVFSLHSKFKCETATSSFWTSHTVRETDQKKSVLIDPDF